MEKTIPQGQNSTPKKRVLVTGVFDIIHPGHLFLFEKAAELGDVIAIVAADENAKKFRGTYH